MSTPGIDPVVIAPNTPACGRRLRPWRVGRQNYAQCFETRLERGRLCRRTGPDRPSSAVLTVGFRTAGAGTPTTISRAGKAHLDGVGPDSGPLGPARNTLLGAGKGPSRQGALLTSPVIQT